MRQNFLTHLFDLGMGFERVSRHSFASAAWQVSISMSEGAQSWQNCGQQYVPLLPSSMPHSLFASAENAGNAGSNDRNKVIKGRANRGRLDCENAGVEYLARLSESNMGLFLSASRRGPTLQSWSYLLIRGAARLKGCETSLAGLTGGPRAFGNLVARSTVLVVTSKHNLLCSG